MEQEKYEMNAKQMLHGMLQYEVCQTHVLNAAMTIFRRLSDQDHVRRRGVVLRAVVGACYYYACHKFGVSKTPAEIRTIFSLQKREMTRGCRLLLKSQAQPLATHNPVEVVYFRFGNQLRIPYPKLIRVWEEVQAKALPLKGTPPTIAAGLLYHTIQLLPTCPDLPDLARISALTHVSPVIIETVSLNVQARLLELELLNCHLPLTPV